MSGIKNDDDDDDDDDDDESLFIIPVDTRYTVTAVA